MKNIVKTSMYLGYALGAYIFLTEGWQLYALYFAFGAISAFMIIPTNKALDATEWAFITRSGFGGLPLFMVVLYLVTFPRKVEKKP